ncbi:Ribosome biogenesis protein slx9-like [Actinidia chinensis var. chinensis]|uniref:Ribosome biogenesis protein slx9-like n=1 Tax=Actinidia chinensis var. chinensis TaxID=1590841 RepID=A0A2R6RH25_ACTCC|nr:Ribosome biogenesis protein slx9-like [Actinidia chinensis var. chinensis]
MGKTRSEPSTRADLKFEKKLEFYAKVRDTVASLSAQKAISKKTKVRSRKKKLKAYDLSTLSEFLPDLKAPRQQTPTEFKLNSKSRQNLVLKEANQLKTVLSHPAFQLDPLAAIHQHLQSTQPVEDEKPERKNIKRGKNKAKKKKPRTLSVPRAMDL